MIEKNAAKPQMTVAASPDGATRLTGCWKTLAETGAVSFARDQGAEPSL
jgi:hypothetical protein